MEKTVIQRITKCTEEEYVKASLYISKDIKLFGKFFQQNLMLTAKYEVIFKKVLQILKFFTKN